MMISQSPTNIQRQERTNMKKLLLIGKFNHVMESLNQYLANHFDVQLCVQNMESVNGMVKITRPDLLPENCC